MKTDRLKLTPLQRIVGIDVAEEIYDNLPIYAQYILDLKIEGYTEHDIAAALGISQSRVSAIFSQAKYYLVDSKLHLILESRVIYRETHRTVMEKE